MNQALLRRMIWKEYRTFRGFWIAMVVLAVGLQFFFVYAHRLYSDRPVEAEALGFLALGMSVFYALGIGATVFNFEQEQATWEQLRAWPSSFRVPWLGKLLFALGSFILLSIVLSFTTRWIWGPFHIYLCWMAGLVGLVVLAIAINCSLLIRRPLLSVFTAGACSLCLLSSSNWFKDVARDGRMAEMMTVVFLVAFSLVALGISYLLGRHWFTDRPRIAAKWRMHERSSALRSAARYSQLTRMAWLSLRQLGWIWLGTLILITLVLLTTPGTDLIALLFFWPPVIGATLFSGDQSDRSYQFLSERGVSARQLWWQRQAIGLIVFLGMLSVSGTAVIRVWAESMKRGDDFPTVISYLAYCLLAYSWGQMSSVFVRSLLLSVSFALAGAVPLAAWSAFAGWFRLPLWLAVAIPVAGLWAASRVRASNWILDRDRLRHWLAALAVLLVAVSATVLGFYLHRAYEIPWVEPRATAEQVAQSQKPGDNPVIPQIERVLYGLTRPPTPDESNVSVVQMKAEGIELSSWNDLPRPISAEESRWLRDHSEALDDSVLQMLEATPTVHRPGRRQNYDTSVRMQWLVRLLVAQARERQSTEELRDALASYQNAMHACNLLRPGGESFDWWMATQGESTILHNLMLWAADRRQTDNQLQRAIEWSHSWFGTESSWTTPLTVDAQLQREAIHDLPSRFRGFDSAPEVPILSFPTDEMTLWSATIPGERQRWQRLTNVLERSYQEAVQAYIRDMHRRESILQLFSGDTNTQTWFSRGDRRRFDHWSQLESWITSTPLFRRFANSMSDPRSLLVSQVLLENQRRATHLRLRIIQWKRQHESYPASLVQLQVGPDDVLPLEVLTGRPFEYLLQGLETDAVRYYQFQEPAWVDASNVPLVASPEALLKNLARYGGYDQAIRSCVYPIPPMDIGLQHEDTVE